jgi:hypothetical protein
MKCCGKRLIQYNTGSGGNVEILDEGVSINPATGKLNFIGNGVVAQQDDNLTTQVNVYIPPVNYSPFFNTGTCLISDITTTDRYISNPNDEFQIGDWVSGSSHSCINSSTISYFTPVKCSIKNTATTFKVEIIGADGNIIITSNIVTISGNINNTTNNVNIIVSGWEIDTNKYKANIIVNIDIQNILTTGGRFSIRMTHTNSTDGVFIKTQNDIFYDNQSNSATINSISMSEINPVTRYISGIEYYDINSEFSVVISDIDNLNDKSYPLNQIEVDGSEYGINNLNLQGGELSNWDNNWNNTNASYIKNNWKIDIPNMNIISSTSNVRTRTKDWSDGDWINSSDNALLIDTFVNNNTRLREYFHHEDWRCPITANFDSGNAKAGWNSSIDLNSNDAVVWNGGVGRDLRNWNIYNPNGVNQPDYSTMDNDVWYYREFQHTGTASSGMTINIIGTYVDIEYKLAKAWDGTSSGGTDWVSGIKTYSVGDWNNGMPLNNTGGQIGATGHVSFGTNNIVNCNNTVYIRVKFIGTQKITALSVVFD